MDVIKILEKRIERLKEWEWQAGEAKDYSTCLQLYGAIIHLTQFLKELEDDRDKSSYGNGKAETNS